MAPLGTLENPFELIRRKLRAVPDFSPGPLDCVLCGKRMGTMREAVVREDTDNMPLCQQCFELVLKAAQSADHTKLADDSLNDFHRHLA